MLLAALLDLYVKLNAPSKSLPEDFEEAAAPWIRQVSGLLKLEGRSRIEVKRVERSLCPALKIDFYVGEQHADSHHGHHHRRLRDVREILRREELSPEACFLAERVFSILAEAEAVAHQSTPEEVHFHEVAAFDSIMDIAGVSALCVLLAPDRIMATPPSVGSGSVSTAHGVLSVPTPAVLEILEKHRIPRAETEIPFEALTPTGAALLAALVDTWSDLSAEIPEIVGLGAGSRDGGPLPNIVRAFIHSP
jgi:uncharacterized protein (DUF111 family)